MHLRILTCCALIAVLAGCDEGKTVEIPAGHRGLVCVTNNGTEYCGLLLHQPGPVYVREDERLRLVDCSPFVRSARTPGMLRDGVAIEITSDLSYEVNCRRSQIRSAFYATKGDVSSDDLFGAFGKVEADEALRFSSSAFSSAEIMKEPDRVVQLAQGFIGREKPAAGPLTLKRFAVTAISLDLKGQGHEIIYDITR